MLVGAAEVTLDAGHAGLEQEVATLGRKATQYPNAEPVELTRLPHWLSARRDAGEGAGSRVPHLGRHRADARTTKPRGFSASEATLATSLLGPMPTELLRPV